ncbi:cupin domain-containing protein [Halosegnis marinus]|uniref:Cupin domain-containing protein n=1 Tax=Halosegnis marinus TaxID=3034023 RepID=A0ABD5ZKJ8_9EURY|nr:cupin domain-containing protein [Halosegnis sp. DT85]
MDEHATEYAHVVVDELPDAPNPTRHKKEVDEAVGATEFGFNVVTADPGEKVPWGYHSHPDHEELFYVLDGSLLVETPEREYEVAAGEAFFVPRGKPQRAVAGGDGCRLVATGAPKATDGAVIEEECPECGETTGRDYRAEEVDETTVYVLSCAACGAETDRLTPGP